MSAITKTFNINLDTKREDVNRGFHLIEGDNGNVFHITLTDNGAAVDLTGTLINVIFSSKNGVVSQTNDPSVEDNGVTIGGVNNNEITIEVFRTSFGVGMNEVEIQVYSKSTGADAYDTLITTARFNFDCVRSLINDDTVYATHDFPILLELIQTVTNAITTVSPFFNVTASAEAGNSADITLSIGDDSVNFGFVIPNSVYVGDDEPTGDEEVWIIPGGEGGSSEGTVMNTEVYDQDEDGVVDDSEKLGGELPSYYATASALSTEITNRQDAIALEVSDRNAAIAAEAAKKGEASGYASLDANKKVTPTEASSRMLYTTSGKTLELTDAGCFLRFNSSSNLTVTIPANADVEFPLGTEIEICRWGTGTLTIAAASGVTLNSPSGLKKVAVQYGTVGLKKINTDTWLLTGSLAS